MPVVTPKPLSGFPELLPAEQLVFNRCVNIIRDTFERYGFSPIETPAVERKEVLTSKGGNEKEIYALSRLSAGPGESADTDLALHFDLTVPLARYVALHKDKLVFPFRRYQIQKVWRGERPQAGRYRELYQADIDVIGRGSVSLLADAEMPSIIYQIFRQMEIGPFQIRINNRRMMQGFLESLSLQPAQMVETLHAIDDLEKIGRDKVRAALLNKASLSEDQTNVVLDFIETSNTKSTDDVLAFLRELIDELKSSPAGSEKYAQGVNELATVVEAMRSLGVPDEFFKVDLTVIRGLDYYTGTVYETKLFSQPDLGSICSGGRYDDLASFFTNEKLPGVGISIGLSRLVMRLIEKGVLKADAATPAKVLVTTMQPERMQDYLKLAADLRNAGIPTEIFYEKKGLGDQLKYANRKGFACAVIAGSDEFAAGNVLIRNMGDGTQTSVSQHDLAAWLMTQESLAKPQRKEFLAP
jgi:histidyl-tRNA synthetase